MGLNRLAFVALAAACIGAAGVGGYLATRQNVTSMAAPDAAAASVVPNPKPVQETEARLQRRLPQRATLRPRPSQPRQRHRRALQSASGPRPPRQADRPQRRSRWPPHGRPNHQRWIGLGQAGRLHKRLHLQHLQPTPRHHPSFTPTTTRKTSRVPRNRLPRPSMSSSLRLTLSWGCRWTPR
jgi:hypothetical protein